MEYIKLTIFTLMFIIFIGLLMDMANYIGEKLGFVKFFMWLSLKKRKNK